MAQPETPAATGHEIRVDLNVYTPGCIPFGFGEPCKVAQELADAWEKKHTPHFITFQQQILTGLSEGEWLVTQLMGGIAPEIIHMNAEVAWPHAKKGWFLPLDEYLERPNPYVPGNKRWMDQFTNQALLGAKRATDGKLYCIPIDIVETGLYYNKTLLDKLGIHEIPETWTQMMETLRRVKAQKVIPMTAAGNLASDWGQDIIFEQLYHDILPDLDLIPSRADAEGYLGHYLEPHEAAFLFTKGFFTRRDPRWREMNTLLKEWRGCWAQELKHCDPKRLFLTSRLAFFWDGSWLIRRLENDPYVDFEWGTTYIPTITKETSRFASGTPATVIGGAAVQLHVTNSAKLNGNLEQCIDWLMYLTAPKSIQAITSEALVFIPNIRGADMDPSLAPFEDIFQRPYCAIKWLDSFDGRYKKYWRRMLDYYLHDGFELDEFLEVFEENFAAWVEHHRNDAGWDFARMEAVWQERAPRLLRELEAP